MNVDVCQDRRIDNEVLKDLYRVVELLWNDCMKSSNLDASQVGQVAHDYRAQALLKMDED